MGISTNKVTAIILSCCIFSFVAAAASAFAATNYNRIIHGVTSDGRQLGGMTKDEAEAYFLRTGKQKLARGAAVLQFEDKSFPIRPEEIRLTVDAAAAADAAYAIGHSGRPFADLATQISCAINGQEIKLPADFDAKLLAAKIAETAESINRQPVNASCDFAENGQITRTAGVSGRKLNQEAVADELAPKLRALQIPATLALTPDEQKPFIQDEDLASIDGVLGSYTTRYSPGSRGSNISIATSRLAHTLIRSQASFSFNEIVGSRTAAAGYKTAGVILNGRFAQDIGGGVCQVSTTLYNAVLLSGLTPTDRSPHYYPSTYCPPGRDATVADGLLDFQFKNQFAHPVYLLTSDTGSSITIYVLGTMADLEGDTITLASEGSRMRPSLYRIWSRNGEVINREYLHTDSYASPMS